MRISDWSSDVCSSDLSVDSSCTSPSIISFLASSSSAIFSISRDFCTWNGISVTTIWKPPPLIFSTSQRARSRNEPLPVLRSEEHTSELQSLMRISYAVFCLKKKTQRRASTTSPPQTLPLQSYALESLD